MSTKNESITVHQTNPSAWAHDAWGRYPGGYGLTVPAEALGELIARVRELEALQAAVENRITVTVSTVPTEVQS